MGGSRENQIATDTECTHKDVVQCLGLGGLRPYLLLSLELHQAEPEPGCQPSSHFVPGTGGGAELVELSAFPPG